MKIVWILLDNIRKRYEKNIFKVRACGIESIGDNSCMDYPFTLRGKEYISIGENVHFSRGCRLQAWDCYEGRVYKPQIRIGNDVSINMDVDISAINKIEIGNGVQIASNVLITDHFHGKIVSEENEIPPAKRELYSRGPVIIEDNVWIGFNVCILPGVTIGKGSIIGAGAIVSKDVPRYSVIVGNGTIIKKLK